MNRFFCTFYNCFCLDSCCAFSLWRSISVCRNLCKNSSKGGGPARNVYIIPLRLEFVDLALYLFYTTFCWVGGISEFILFPFFDPQQIHRGSHYCISSSRETTERVGADTLKGKAGSNNQIQIRLILQPTTTFR